MSSSSFLSVFFYVETIFLGLRTDNSIQGEIYEDPDVFFLAPFLTQLWSLKTP